MRWAQRGISVEESQVRSEWLVPEWVEKSGKGYFPVGR